MSYYQNLYNQPLSQTVNTPIPTQSDIQLPKQQLQQSLGLRQIKEFDVVDSFQDANGRVWRLVKRSTDSSIEIPDPQYLQVTDYWCHEFPDSNPKTYIYVVEGIKHPRETDENAQKTCILYQWFSTTNVKGFTPQMITQQEWHRANVYSSELIDSRLSKLVALCKIQLNKNNEPVNPQKDEYIEDISLETMIRQ